MKTLTFLILFIFLFLNGFSQHAPDAFLGRIPDVNRLGCDEEISAKFLIKKAE